MLERDIEALDALQLLPRVLHDVQHADTRLGVLERDLDAPIVPLLEGVPQAASDLCIADAEALLEQPDGFPFAGTIAMLKPEKMGALMPKVRTLAARDVPAFALDLASLAHTPPFGTGEWRPRTREDLAELAAAAGRPLWLYGIASPADAEIATEAGVDGIVVYSGAGRHVQAPATALVFPEILDAVAGMTRILAGGPIRDGIDVFRYLALGAEAVVVHSDRSTHNLRAELEYAMRLTGCATLAEISYDAIFEPLWTEGA